MDKIYAAIFGGVFLAIFNFGVLYFFVKKWFEKKDEDINNLYACCNTNAQNIAVHKRRLDEQEEDIKEVKTDCKVNHK
jgi:hypothetical protein